MQLPPTLSRAIADQRTDPLSLLFPLQLAVADDLLKPDARVAMHPGRRGGKTSAFVRAAAKKMLAKPGALVAFFGLTKTSAENIMWADVSRVVRELGLSWKPNRSNLTFTAPNGSTFFVLGAKDAKHVEIARGMAWDLVGIDECGSFSPTLLRYFADDVLEPALADYHGSLALMGTPGAVCAGYYHEACQPGSRWSVHHWDMRDNPHIPHAAEWLAKLKESRGWAEDNPTLMREYYGQWVLDEDSLVYRFDPDRNGADAMPPDYDPQSDKWAHVLGIDYGIVDSSAWVVLAFRIDASGRKDVWVVESFKRAGLLTSQAAEVTVELHQRYDFDRIVGDAGGLGKPYVAEARQRYGLPIEAADKRMKLGQIERVNDALLTGQMRVIMSGNADYIEEMRTLQWDTSAVEVTINGLVRHEQRKRPDPRFEDHLCDAGQYAFGACRAWLNDEPPLPPPSDPAHEWETGPIDDESDDDDTVWRAR